jgi:hypothetical protein
MISDAQRWQSTLSVTSRVSGQVAVIGNSRGRSVNATAKISAIAIASRMRTIAPGGAAVWFPSILRLSLAPAKLAVECPRSTLRADAECPKLGAGPLRARDPTRTLWPEPERGPTCRSRFRKLSRSILPTWPGAWAGGSRTHAIGSVARVASRSPTPTTTRATTRPLPRERVGAGRRPMTSRRPRLGAKATTLAVPRRPPAPRCAALHSLLHTWFDLKN